VAIAAAGIFVCMFWIVLVGRRLLDGMEPVRKKYIHFCGKEVRKIFRNRVVCVEKIFDF